MGPKVIIIGGGLFKYLFSFLYENLEIKNYFRNFCLPIIRLFLNNEFKLQFGVTWGTATTPFFITKYN